EGVAIEDRQRSSRGHIDVPAVGADDDFTTEEQCSAGLATAFRPTRDAPRGPALLHERSGPRIAVVDVEDASGFVLGRIGDFVGVQPVGAEGEEAVSSQQRALFAPRPLVRRGEAFDTGGGAWATSISPIVVGTSSKPDQQDGDGRKQYRGGKADDAPGEHGG